MIDQACLSNHVKSRETLKTNLYSRCRKAPGIFIDSPTVNCTVGFEKPNRRL